MNVSLSIYTRRYLYLKNPITKTLLNFHIANLPRPEQDVNSPPSNYKSYANKFIPRDLENRIM